MNPATRKTIAIGLILLGLVLVNYLAGVLSFRWDFTQDRLYTLSPGTRSLLAQIEEPVSLQFYFSASVEGVPTPIKNYATRVEQMLRQYVARGRGAVTLQVIDPRPDTPEEEAAARAGLQAQTTPTGENVYFGLVAIQADMEATIPFFVLNREPFLEYDLSKLIYSVQQFDKPRLGLISSIPLMGAPQMPGMPPQPQQPRRQVVVQEWEQTYEIEEIDPGADALSDSFDVLAVIHPQELSPGLLYAIDQFLLSGRPVFLALDPSSRFFRAQAGQQQMFGGPPPGVSSDLPELLSAWGIRYRAEEVVGDTALATTVSTGQGTVAYPVWLSLRDEHFNDEAPPTSLLNSLLFVEAGHFSLRDDSDHELTPLVQATARNGIINPMLLQFTQPEELAAQIAATGTPMTLAGLIRGTFSSAFPDGPPAPADDDDSPPPPRPETHLRESARPGTLLFVADTDWLLDDYSVRRFNFLGMTALEPLNDNLSFASNSLEFLGGSEDLIGIRSKGTSVRPFEVVRKMELAAQERYQARLQELEARLTEVQENLRNLQARRDEAGQIVASPEIQEAIEEFRVEEARMRAERREIRKALREDIERLETVLLLLNLLAVPGLVGVAGIWFFTLRSRRRRG
ncbi:MAG: ABC transporter [Puniceicoccaceae bacterium]|nr:MAG: ABC transporter [Puniceicoccaceae bacterium]